MVEEDEYDYPTEQTDAEEDYAEDELEDQSEFQQDALEDFAPSQMQKDDLYSLFWKVIKNQDSSKVGNVSADELGMFDISVRDLQKIQLLADSLGHPTFGRYFGDQAEIILSTSSSKEGWLPELFVSSKQSKVKSRKFNVANLHNQPQKKKLFKWRGKSRN